MVLRNLLFLFSFGIFCRKWTCTAHIAVTLVTFVISYRKSLCKCTPVPVTSVTDAAVVHREQPASSKSSRRVQRKRKRMDPEIQSTPHYCCCCCCECNDNDGKYVQGKGCRKYVSVTTTNILSPNITHSNTT